VWKHTPKFYLDVLHLNLQLTKQNNYDIILIESEGNKMRKLNYDIKIGTRFYLPKASWQVAKIAGNYEITERRRYPDYDDGERIEYVCVSTEHPYQAPVAIAEMTLAYILGEDVEGEVNVVYSGREYQPTGLDDFRVATEYDGVECSEPFWYLGDSGERYHIDVDFETDKWCFFKLPWD
jgi:hypothetical protein